MLTIMRRQLHALTNLQQYAPVQSAQQYWDGDRVIACRLILLVSASPASFNLCLQDEISSRFSATTALSSTPLHTTSKYDGICETRWMQI